MSEDKKKSAGTRFNKHLRTRLMSGLLVLIPVAITLFILNVIFNSLTAFVRPLVKPLLSHLPQYVLPLIALAVTVLIIYLVGLITTHIVGRKVIQWGEGILLQLPVVKTVYAASKQVVDTVSSSKKETFKAVVLVEFPRKGSHALGFVTGTMTAPDGKTLFRVFIATTPNPTSGFLILYSADDVQFTNISVEEGIKMIVSGGMLAPPTYATVPPPALLETNGDISEPSLNG